MRYRVIFDVTSPPWDAWLFSMAGLLFVLGGIVAYATAREKHGKEQAIGAGLIISAVGVAFTFMNCSDANSRHDSLVAGLRAGRVSVLEGRVSRYVHRGFGLDHTPESWVVRGHTFVIQPGEVRISFNKPGVVQPGDSLRITLADEEIVRLERVEP